MSDKASDENWNKITPTQFLDELGRHKPEQIIVREHRLQGMYFLWLDGFPPDDVFNGEKR
jgi:hypothetical protein